MTYPKTSRHHSGHYVCSADNGFGTPTTAHITLDVQRKLLIIINFIKLHVKANVICDQTCRDRFQEPKLVLRRYERNQSQFLIILLRNFGLTKISNFQTHQGSNRSKLLFTPEKMTKLRSYVSFIRHRGLRFPGSRMACLCPKIRGSLVKEATDTSCCCQESRDPPSAPILAKPRTSWELMKELPKFPVRH